MDDVHQQLLVVDAGHNFFQVRLVSDIVIGSPVRTCLLARPLANVAD